MKISPTPLQRAVLRQLTGSSRVTRYALDTLRVVAKHGADGGYYGFTYYRDTHGFFARHRSNVIRELIEEYGSISLALSEIAGFGCLSHYDKEEIATAAMRALCGARLDDDDEATISVINALAWYALESVAHQLTGGE